ncbi:MAG: DUF1501 domain-containing protein, partial [Myxococcota bacterium]
MTQNRRTFLRSLGLGMGTGAWLLSSGQMPKLLADPNKEQLRNFLFCYFRGGWDLLLSLDPRDPGKFSESKIRETKIQLGWDRLQDPFRPDIIQPSGSNIEFGPAIGDFAKHFDKACLIRGMTSGTLGHEIGRRFFITGQQPRGLNATGSSVSTRIVAQQGAQTPIPNLVIAMESYNRGNPAFATGLQVSNLRDLQSTLRDGPNNPKKGVRELIDQFRKEDNLCDPTEHNQQGMMSLLRTMQHRARDLVAGDLYSYFDLNSQRDILERYNTRVLGEGASQAAIAFQALKNNVAQCISIRLAGGLDTHGSDWATSQPMRLYNGFQALSILMDDLKATDHPKYPGKLIDHTTVVVFSEFGRTALLNVDDGRDHALSTSVL